MHTTHIHTHPQAQAPTNTHMHTHPQTHTDTCTHEHTQTHAPTSTRNHKHTQYEKRHGNVHTAPHHMQVGEQERGCEGVRVCGVRAAVALHHWCVHQSCATSLSASLMLTPCVYASLMHTAQVCASLQTKRLSLSASLVCASPKRTPLVSASLMHTTRVCASLHSNCRSLHY